MNSSNNVIAMKPTSAGIFQHTSAGERMRCFYYNEVLQHIKDYSVSEQVTELLYRELGSVLTDRRRAQHDKGCFDAARFVYVVHEPNTISIAIFFSEPNVTSVEDLKCNLRLNATPGGLIERLAFTTHERRKDMSRIISPCLSYNEVFANLATYAISAEVSNIAENYIDGALLASGIHPDRIDEVQFSIHRNKIGDTWLYMFWFDRVAGSPAINLPIFLEMTECGSFSDASLIPFEKEEL